MFHLVIRIKVIIELELKDRELTAVFHNDALFALQGATRNSRCPFPIIIIDEPFDNYTS